LEVIDGTDLDLVREKKFRAVVLGLSRVKKAFITL
jgi:hypothetical protein